MRVNCKNCGSSVDSSEEYRAGSCCEGTRAIVARHELERLPLPYLPYDVELIDAPLWWHTQGLSQTASGYGAKLTTRHKVKHNGRFYRVYATCFSNCASHWIECQGERLYLR